MENIKYLVPASVQTLLYRIKSNLIHQTDPGKVLRRLVWSDGTAEGREEVIWTNEVIAFHDKVAMQTAPSPIRDYLEAEPERWARLDEKIYRHTGRILIEPKLGLGFIPPRTFLPLTRLAAHTHQVPSLVGARLGQFLRRRTHYVETLVHFDGYFSRNIYHFVTEGLGALLVLRWVGSIPTNTPILIHEQLLQHSYVRFFLAVPPFNEFNWFVQKRGEWIETRTLFKVWPTLLEYPVLQQQLLRRAAGSPRRRVFLNRRPKYRRCIVNFTELEPALARYGFETIYAEDHTYDEQVAIFADTEYLIAIHGAGITNIIHANVSSLSLLELFAENFRGPHYFWMMKVLGGKYYDGIQGSKLNAEWNFTLDADTFAAALERMMTYKRQSEKTPTIVS